MNIKRRFTPEAKAEIVLEILKKEKSLSEIAALHQIHPVQLAKWKKEVVDQLPQLFVNEKKNIHKMKNEYEERINELYAEVDKLSTQLAWLKKNLENQLTREERLALVEWEDFELPISMQAELLNLNRTSLYYKPVPLSPEEIRIKRRIDQIYNDYPFFGSRRITAVLQHEGIQVYRNTVQKYMNEMGLQAFYPYLLHSLKIERPNHVWGIDITYIRMVKGWMYLVAIIVLPIGSSPKVDQTLELPFVLEASDRALQMCPRYLELFETAGTRISMDGKGRAHDNIFTDAGNTAPCTPSLGVSRPQQYVGERESVGGKSSPVKAGNHTLTSLRNTSFVKKVFETEFPMITMNGNKALNSIL